MALFGKASKAQLLELADDLGVAVGKSWSKFDVKKAITGMEGFDETFALGSLEAICAREERDRQEAQKERDRQEAQKERDRQEAQKERDRQEAREERERQETREREERAFELEKLRLANESTIRTSTPQPAENSGRKHVPDIKRLMPNFNIEETDVSLYLTIFERQLRAAQVEEDLWSSQLLALLPIEVGRIVLQETAEAIPEYQVAKQLLLDRYRLTPEAFRQKFVQHVRKGTARWKDFAFELQGYLDGWLKGLDVTTFEQLKQLMLTDQIKRRAGTEVRSHFIDCWSEIVSPWTLAEKLDRYELVRPTVRKNPSNRESERIMKPSEPAQEFGGYRMGEKRGDGPGNIPGENRHRVHVSPKKDRTSARGNMDFEKRKPPQCFLCGSENHFKINCPSKDKREEKGTERVSQFRTEECNHVRLCQENKSGADIYVSPGRANGIDCSVLRDTGSSIDLVSEKYVPAHFFTGEYVHVKQPLDAESRRLPVARVKLEGRFGCVMTRAAVFRKSLDRCRYIMGNGTAALIADKQSPPRRPRRNKKRRRSKSWVGSRKMFKTPEKGDHLYNPGKVKGKT